MFTDCVQLQQQYEVAIQQGDEAMAAAVREALEQGGCPVITVSSPQSQMLSGGNGPPPKGKKPTG